MEQRFANRRAGVLFWGATYLAGAIGVGGLLAASWPTGGTCSHTCGARLATGVTTLNLVAIGGLVGLGVAVWIGMHRRRELPRVVRGTIVAAALTAVAVVVIVRSGGSGPDATGLDSARGAYAWAFAVPALALLVSSGLAAVTGRRLVPAAVQLAASGAAAAALVVVSSTLN